MLSTTYYLLFIAVLVKRIIWLVGDQTDVLIPAVAALPWGALVFFYPGGRNGAFVFVAVLGTLNAVSIWAVARLVVIGLTRRKPDTMLGLGGPASQTGAEHNEQIEPGTVAR